MVISFKVTLSMVLFHKQTMKELKINEVIERSYDEDSAEYGRMCEEYEEEIGYPRVFDEKKFDKELLDLLVKQAEQVQKERIERIEGTIKTCYYQGTTAFISFGGYMINPSDFCAIRFNAFNVQVTKK